MVCSFCCSDIPQEGEAFLHAVVDTDTGHAWCCWYCVFAHAASVGETWVPADTADVSPGEYLH